MSENNTDVKTENSATTESEVKEIPEESPSKRGRKRRSALTKMTDEVILDNSEGRRTTRSSTRGSAPPPAPTPPPVKKEKKTPTGKGRGRGRKKAAEEEDEDEDEMKNEEKEAPTEGANGNEGLSEVDSKEVSNKKEESEKPKESSDDKKDGGVENKNGGKDTVTDSSEEKPVGDGEKDNSTTVDAPKDPVAAQ